MKKLFTYLLLTTFLFTGFNTYSQTDNPRKIVLEKKVKVDAQDRHGENYEVKSVKHNDDYILVKGMQGDKKLQSYYSTSGEFEETVHTTEFAELPDVVKKRFLMSNLSEADIQNVYLVQMENENFYAIEGRKDDDMDTRFIFINPSGEELSKRKKLLFMNKR